MIRINLVAGERRAAKFAGPSFQIGRTITVAGSVLLLVTALLLGWRYWSVVQHEAQLARDIDAGRREEGRLAEVLKQVAEFEAQGAQRQERVQLIDELRRGQSAPVHMIDQVSRALPEMTWLTDLRQEGYDVTIQGRCLSLTSLSDFVGNLESTRYFKRPVEIVTSAVVSEPGGGPDLIEFTIKGTFRMAGIAQSPPPPAARPRGGKVG